MIDRLIDECREEFEKWYLGENPTNTDMCSIQRAADYELMTTRINWIAWQAAWKASDLRWQRSFKDHVYVKNERYAEICEMARAGGLIV